MSLPNRISSLNDASWLHELSREKQNLTELKKFEDYLRAHFRFFGKGSTPMFDLHTLRDYIRTLCDTYGFDMTSLIEQFNGHFSHILEDSIMTQRAYLKRYCNLNIDSVTKDQIDCIDLNTSFMPYGLSPENVENIILRYHIERGKHPNHSAVSLHMPSNRKLSPYDFNELCVRYLTTSELEHMINRKYTSVNNESLYQEYLNRIERQDKFYFIDINETTPRPIPEAIRKLDDKTFNLYTELQSLKQKFSILSFQKKIDLLCAEIKEELELIEMAMKFDTLLDNDDWTNAKKLLLDYSFSRHQTCLLIQILNGTLDVSIDRYTTTYRTFIQSIIDHFFELNININIDCYEYISDKIPACLHKTFHYYCLHKWVLAFNKILVQKRILTGPPYSLTPDDKKQMNTLRLDPKNGFCNKCYDSYDALKQEIINTSLVPNQAPRELFVLLFKYKNKMPVYRLRFSDQCDIASELRPTLDHSKEYLNTLDGAKNVQNKLLNAIKEELFINC